MTIKKQLLLSTWLLISIFPSRFLEFDNFSLSQTLSTSTNFSVPWFQIKRVYCMLDILSFQYQKFHVKIYWFENVSVYNENCNDFQSFWQFGPTWFIKILWLTKTKSSFLQFRIVVVGIEGEGKAFLNVPQLKLCRRKNNVIFMNK